MGHHPGNIEGIFYIYLRLPFRPSRRPTYVGRIATISPPRFRARGGSGRVQACYIYIGPALKIEPSFFHDSVACFPVGRNYFAS